MTLLLASDLPHLSCDNVTYLLRVDSHFMYSSSCWWFILSFERLSFSLNGLSSRALGSRPELCFVLLLALLSFCYEESMQQQPNVVLSYQSVLCLLIVTLDQPILLAWLLYSLFTMCVSAPYLLGLKRKSSSIQDYIAL